MGSISEIELWQAGILHSIPLLLTPFDTLTALSTVEGPQILAPQAIPLMGW